MAASGYTPISLYYSATATRVPLNTNLQNGELGLNIADGKLYYKDNVGVVQLLASKSLVAPTFSAGTTGLLPNTPTTSPVVLSGVLNIASGGTNSSATATLGGVGYGTGTAHAYTAAGTAGYVLTSNGAAAPTWQASGSGGGAVTTFSAGTTGFTPSTASAGAITLGGTLGYANGGTGTSAVPTAGGAVYGTGTTHATTAVGTTGQVLTSQGSSAPTWVTTVSSVSGGTTGLTPSTATTGAITLAGTLAVANGGTGLTSLAPTYIPYGVGTSAFGSSSGLTFNVSTGVLTSTGHTVNSDATIHGVVVGLGTNSVSSNTVVGNNALNSGALSGAGNVAIGQNTLTNNASGYSNLAAGQGALQLNSAGYQNTAIGASALTANASGTRNTAVGYAALSNCTASLNTSVGMQSLGNITTGSSNVGMGVNVLVSSQAGSSNTAIGYSSMTAVTTGNFNTALGYNALLNLTTGSGNVMLGGMTSAGVYAPATDLTVATNDQISIGSTSTTNAYIKVAWTVVSDARDKTNFAPIPHGLDFVTKLKPISYQFKFNREIETAVGDVKFGFLAQDILALEGDKPVIIDNKDLNNLKITSDNIIPVLVNALQELNAKFDAYVASHP